MAAVQAISNVPRSVMYAMGRSDWLYRWGLAYCLVGAVFMVVGTHWGLLGVSVGLALVVAVLAPIEMRMALALIDMPLRDVRRARCCRWWRSRPPRRSCRGAAAVVVDRVGLGAASQLVIGTLVGVVAYGGLLLADTPPARCTTRGAWRGR